MATSGTGAIITRGQLVNKFGADYWKNKTLPATVGNTQCVTADWINANINSPNYKWTKASTYSDAGKKLVQAVHCYNGSTNYLVPDVKYEYSIGFSAAASDINVGSTGKFTVTLTTKTYTGGVLTNTATEDVSGSCTWSSSSTANATVSSNGTVTGVKGKNNGTADAVAVTITATHPSYGTISKDVNIKDVITYMIVVSPSSANINVGSTSNFKAYRRTKINNVATSNYDTEITTSCTWSSSSTANATVSSNGTVTGVKGKNNGTADAVAVTITASYSGYTSGSATANIKDVVSSRAHSVVITTSDFTAKYNSNSTKQLVWKTYDIKTVNGKDYGSEYEVTGKTVTFTSDKPNNVSVNSSGVTTFLKGANDGTENAVSVTISAVYGNSDSITVTAVDVVTRGNAKSRRLAVTATKTSLSAGDKATLSATGYTTYKLNINGTDSSTYVWGEDNDGAVSCTWTTSNSNIAKISSSSGSSITVTGVQGADGYSTAAATANIKAVNSTYNSSGVTTTISVTNVLSERVYSVDITTGSFTLQYGVTTTLQLAWKTYNIHTRNGVDHGSAYEVTGKTVTFSSSNTAKATVNSSGKVTWVAGKGDGTENGVSVTITATYSGKTDTVTCTTKDNTSKGGVKSRRLAVSATKTSLSAGEAATLSAKGYTTYKLNINGTDSSTYTWGEESDGAVSCTWSTSNSNIAKISSSSGSSITVTGVQGADGYSTAAATANIKAVNSTYNSSGVTTTISVTNVLSTRAFYVDITTANFTLQYGGTTTQQLAWKTYDIKTRNGSDYGSAYEVTGKTVTFSSSNTAKATVNSSGKVTWVTGKGDGTENTVSVTITAACTGYSSDTVTCYTKDKVVKGGVKSRRLSVYADKTSLSAGGTTLCSATGYTTYKKNINGVDSSTYTWGEENDGLQSCTWSTSNSNIAKISSTSGIAITVTGVQGADGYSTAAATANIKAVNSTYNSSGATTTISVTNVLSSRAHSIDITTGSFTLQYGGTTTQQLAWKTYDIKTRNGVNYGSVYEVTGKTVTFSSSNTAKATVNSSGKVTFVAGKGDGTENTVSTTITASCTGYSSDNVTCNTKDKVTQGAAKSRRLTVTASPTDLYVGSTSTCTGTGYSTYYKNINGVQSSYTYAETNEGAVTCTWSSSSTANATVNSSGVVTAVKGMNDGTQNPVTVTITAKNSTYNSSGVTILFGIRDKITGYSLSITSPSSAATIYVGSTQTYTATGYTYINNGTTKYSQGTVSCTWTSSSTSVATMSGATATGKAGKGDGTENTVSTTITASHSTYGSATQTLYVKDKVTQGGVKSRRIALKLKQDSSGTGTLTVGGSTITVAATGYTTYKKKINGTDSNTYAYAEQNDGAVTCTWSSNKTANATVNSSGVVTGVKGKNDGTDGTVTVTITGSNSTYGSSTINVYVKDNITYGYTYRLAISGGSTSINAGASTTWTAKYYTTVITYKNGSVYSSSENSGSTVTSSATWTSSNTAIATVSAGTVTGKAAKYGTVTITAKYNGYSATRNITVNYSYNSYYVSPAVVTVPAVSTPNINACKPLNAYMVTYSNGVAGTPTNRTAKSTWSNAGSIYGTVITGGIYAVGATKVGTAGVVTAKDNDYGYSATAMVYGTGSTGGSTGGTTTKVSGVIGATISSTGPTAPASMLTWGYSYEYTPGNLGNTAAVPIHLAQNIINGYSFKPKYANAPAVLATSGMYVTRWAPPTQSRKWSSVLSTPGYLWIFMGSGSSKYNNSYGQLLCLNISSSVINAADNKTSSTAITMANCTKYIIV